MKEEPNLHVAEISNENNRNSTDTNKKKTVYEVTTINFYTDRLDKKISDVLTNAESEEMRRIVRKLLEEDCRLQIIYQVVYSKD